VLAFVPGFLMASLLFLLLPPPKKDGAPHGSNVGESISTSPAPHERDSPGEDVGTTQFPPPGCVPPSPSPSPSPSTVGGAGAGAGAGAASNSPPDKLPSLRAKRAPTPPLPPEAAGTAANSLQTTTSTTTATGGGKLHCRRASSPAATSSSAQEEQQQQQQHSDPATSSRALTKRPRFQFDQLSPDLDELKQAFAHPILGVPTKPLKRKLSCRRCFVGWCHPPLLLVVALLGLAWLGLALFAMWRAAHLLAMLCALGRIRGR